MNNDTALILLLADRQREIEALRTTVAELQALLGATQSPSEGA
ncbi:hypothetical protein [Microbacterium telephonicum]|uniref:Uncharacterized protein n=1 Tax=Microbacterium telephonicum TaxID=1714841 RepID=A0A498BVG0_9MICO|nr:hypothetical protein [Microbacterium telephonicum]RLK47605.1 hypothetical protein C7474_2197 [Microbacterium telephonicum]